MRYCTECKKIKMFNFCIFCMEKTKNYYVLKAETGKYEVILNKTKLTHKRTGVKRFISRVIVGWMPSKNIIKHPQGVFISRIIDRENNLYEESIIDKKTGKNIVSKKEPLSEHNPL